MKNFTFNLSLTLYIRILKSHTCTHTHTELYSHFKEIFDDVISCCTLFHKGCIILVSDHICNLDVLKADKSHRHERKREYKIQVGDCSIIHISMVFEAGGRSDYERGQERYLVKMVTLAFGLTDIVT